MEPTIEVGGLQVFDLIDGSKLTRIIVYEGVVIGTVVEIWG